MAEIARNPFDANQTVYVSFSREEKKRSSLLRINSFLLAAFLLVTAIGIIERALKVLSSLLGEPALYMFVLSLIFVLSFSMLVMGLFLLIFLVKSVVDLFSLDEPGSGFLIFLVFSGILLVYSTNGGLFGIAPNLAKRVISALTPMTEIVLVCQNEGKRVVVEEPYRTKFKDGRIFVYLSKEKRAIADVEDCLFVSVDSVSEERKASSNG